MIRITATPGSDQAARKFPKIWLDRYRLPGRRPGPFALQMTGDMRRRCGLALVREHQLVISLASLLVVALASDCLVAAAPS